jgi:hypothetical protein
VSYFEETQRQYKENANKHHKDQPNFKVGDRLASTTKHQNNSSHQKY